MLLALLALPLRQPQQVTLVAERLLLRLPRQVLVTRPEGRQVQVLQVLHQHFLHVRWRRHLSPPYCPVGCHTAPGPPAPRILRSRTGTSPFAPVPPPRRPP